MIINRNKIFRFFYIRLLFRFIDYKKTLKYIKVVNKELKVNTSQELLRGVYANAIRILVNDNEVVLDFALIISDEKETHGELVSRIIVSEKFAKILADSINKTFETHEQKKQQESKQPK